MPKQFVYTILIGVLVISMPQMSFAESNENISDSSNIDSNFGTELYDTPFLAIASAGANMRSLPSQDGKIVITIQSGTVVTVLGETTRWYKIGYNGETGYVNKNLFEEYIGGNTQSDETVKSENDFETGEETESWLYSDEMMFNAYFELGDSTDDNESQRLNQDKSETSVEYSLLRNTEFGMNADEVVAIEQTMDDSPNMYGSKRGVVIFSDVNFLGYSSGLSYNFGSKNSLQSITYSLDDIDSPDQVFESLRNKITKLFDNETINIGDDEIDDLSKIARFTTDDLEIALIQFTDNGNIGVVITPE